MIELTEKDKVSRIWYVALDGADWLCTLLKKADEDHWKVQYRMRYYAAGQKNFDPFNGADKKVWYTVTGEPDELLESTEALAKKMALSAQTRVHRIVIDSQGLAEFQQKMAKAPWTHWRTEPKLAPSGIGAAFDIALAGGEPVVILKGEDDE